MKENGKTTRLMVMVLTSIQMEPPTRDIGQTIFSMDLERNTGLMELFTKATILTGRKMVTVSLNGLMELITKENLTIIISKDKVSTDGAMVGNMLGLGKIIKCMVKGSSPGTMVRNT